MMILVEFRKKLEITEARYRSTLRNYENNIFHAKCIHTLTPKCLCVSHVLSL